MLCCFIDRYSVPTEFVKNILLPISFQVWLNDCIQLQLTFGNQGHNHEMEEIIYLMSFDLLDQRFPNLPFPWFIVSCLNNGFRPLPLRNMRHIPLAIGDHFRNSKDVITGYFLDCELSKKPHRLSFQWPIAANHRRPKAPLRSAFGRPSAFALLGELLCRII